MHRAPEQVIRLIERLNSSESTFVVHVDRHAESSIFSRLQAWAYRRPNVALAVRHRCWWGTFGIVAATLDCVRTALAGQPTFNHAVLLSGQDYPIKSLGQMIATLKGDRQFIECLRLDQPNRWSQDDSYWNAMARIEWYHVNFRSRFLHIRAHRRLPLRMLPYGGSQWWALSRDCLASIDSTLRANPSVLRYFRRVFIPDEVFFQTMTGNSPFGVALDPPVHYVDWNRPNPNTPRTLDVSDFDRLCVSTKLFARKIDSDRSVALLDLIDRELLSVGRNAHTAPSASSQARTCA
jgi:hypothetical protein